MMSDHDNDEIKDSSFPVEFGDTDSLDMYGVWVKSGPRDVSPATQSFAPNPSPAAPTDSSADTEEELEEIADLADFEDLPDLPDFDNAEDDTTTQETILESEEVVKESDATDDFQDIDITFIESMPETVTQPAEHFTEATETSLSGTEESFSEADEPGIIESMDIDGQILDIDFPDEPIEISGKKDTVLDTVEDSAGDIPLETSEEPETLSVEDDFESFAALGDMDIPLPGDSIPDISEFVTSTTGELITDDSEPALPADDDFSEFLDGLNSGPPAVKTDSSDDFDLDAFVNEFNETGGTPEAEKDKIFDDTDPVNIDLEFDESFIEDSERIRATGSSVSESEFYNSEFGVELVDETTIPADDEFDDTFHPVKRSISSDNLGISAGLSEVKLDQTGGLESATEFDDLLASLDDSPVSTAPKDLPKSIQTAKTFSLNVTEEDDLEAVTRTETQSSSDDEIAVPLSAATAFMTDDSAVEKKIVHEELETLMPERDADELPGEKETEYGEDLPPFDGMSDTFDEINLEPEGESSFPEDRPEVSGEEKLDIPEIKDYNDVSTEPEKIDLSDAALEESVFPEFDDISAVERELSEDIPDMGEGQVVSNDKSTELLMIIADELSSIKKEISTLKNELSGFKGASMPQEAVDGSDAKPAENSGFFSDDDTDETIALTGDELNNILITADFTEEKTEDADDGEPATSSGTIDLTSEFLPETVVETEEEPVPDASVQEQDLSEPEIPETLPESLFDMPDLDANMAVEVSHVNKLEDDISYLDGTESIEPDLDDVAIDVPDLEVIDFNDEKLEEPELTEFNIDLTGIENDFPKEQDIPVEAADEMTVAQLDEAVSEPETAEVESIEAFDLDTVEEEIPESIVDMSPDVSLTAGVSIDSGLNDEPPVSLTKTPEQGVTGESGIAALPIELKDEIKSVLSYMDQLLESLPEEKIEEFARSEHFEVYKKLFEELGIS